MNVSIIRGNSTPAVSTSAGTASNKYLSDDGMLNVVAVEGLKNRILTAAKKMDAVVIQGVYYTRKAMGNFAKAKDAKQDPAYLGTRTYQVKANQRIGKNITLAQAPKMIKGSVVLIDVANLPQNLEIEMAQFVSACNKHNKKALSVAEKVKGVKAKIRVSVQKDFESAFKKAEGLFAGKEIVENQTLFGKTAIIKIDADTYLSIGPSSKEKFNAAKRKLAEAAKGA